ncbi:hypothetical protein [Pseudoteredinibacter isoporae]|uniref:hypothetical protein n=1 Tax=Pseudoteredinibacter isoporae TaxID=570281 RepID=UPI003108D490
MSRYFIHYSNFQGVTLFRRGRTGKSKFPDGSLLGCREIDLPLCEFDSFRDAEKYAQKIFSQYPNVRVQIIGMIEKEVQLILENKEFLDKESDVSRSIRK